MAEAFKAGTTTERIAKAYRLSGERVRQILIERLGTEAMWRIIRTHAHNESEDE